MSISHERIKELAHRRATKYTHRSAPHESAYGFTDSHLDDLCRDIRAAIEAECQKAEPVAQAPIAKPDVLVSVYPVEETGGARIEVECFRLPIGRHLLYTSPPDLVAEVERLRIEITDDNRIIKQQAQRIAELEADCKDMGDDYQSCGKELYETGCKLDAAKERITTLEAALREAKEMVESWGAYASPYFQAKHDLVGDIATIDKVLGGNA